MIYPTAYSVSKELLETAYNSLPDIEFKFSLNEPTGEFFYDRWKIKEQFKDTVWEEILNSLLVDNMGEARLINLEIEKCYTMHADIDDRWHLSFNHNNSYLIDLENKKMYQPEPGVWYSMNTGLLHSAVNFGDAARYQLVVRKLLSKHTLVDPVKVIINVLAQPANYRYILDNCISPILNALCKNKQLSNFNHVGDKYLEFTIERNSIPELDAAILSTNINIEVNYYDTF